MVARRGDLSGLSALVSGHQWRRHRRSARHHCGGSITSPRLASMPSGCRRSPSRRRRTWATTSRTTRKSIRLFGTLEDFDALVERAHALGLKIIMDQVLSHTSDKHPWFRESRLAATNSRADWYVWADRKRDGTPPNNWPSVFGGRAWEWNPSRGQYYFHNFLIEQPDLNFHNRAGAGRRARRAALLARARRRRFPARHRQLLLPRPPVPEQSGRRDARSTCPTRSIPTTCRSIAIPRASPRTSSSSSACGPSSTGSPARPPSAKSATATSG